MKRLLLSILTLTVSVWAFDAFAQNESDKDAETVHDSEKVPYIDENGNRIPWYLPMPDEEQTRSTVDMSFAPAEMKMIGPSPAAAGATKYADYSVSYGLGLANISIPIYEVKSHSLTLPISLSYDSGGIRVDDVSGPAGLGWTLEAGGIITRTIVGLDDNSAVGWQYRPDGDPVSASFQNELYLRGVSKGEQDSGSDFYSYNFCGHSGSFYIDRKTTPWTILPTSATDLKIESSGYGFTITDTDGTVYHFTEQETSLRTTSVTVPFSGGSGESYPQMTVPITAWYLSEIVAMDGTDVIKLHYTTYGSLWTSRHANTRTYQFTYRYYSPGNYLWYSTAHQWSGYPDVSVQTGAYVTETSWTPKYLDYITFAGGRVDFEYTQNTGTTTQRRSYPWILDYISVRSLPPASSQNTEVFRASFTIPFQSLDKRNLLTEVALTGRGGTPVETYTLTYIGAGTNMDTNSKDLFGYYNAANNSAGTAFLLLFGNNPYNETVADRSYNSVAVSCLSLETISTASGSKTAFEYEGNSIYTTEPGVLFNTIGIGHRIRRISTYDLSKGGETLIRQRDFTYSSPGITIPAYAFKHNSFMTVNEMFREDLTDGTVWWCGGSSVIPIPRTATVAFSDQSVLPGASLESARIYYGTVTERVSESSSSTSSVRTDYVFDTSGAVHAMTGFNLLSETDMDTHDNDPGNNLPGGTLYHFFQRPPQYVPLNNYYQSVDLSQAWNQFIPEDFPQLTSPTVIRRYKRESNTDVLVSETANEYGLNRDTVRVGLRIRNMIDFGDESSVANIHHCEDFYRAGLNRKRIWYRLIQTTETEWLDNGTQSAVTSYSYLPASTPLTSIPAAGAVLSPKTRTTVHGSGTNARTYSWTYSYPVELASGLPWVTALVGRGYKKPLVENVTAEAGGVSAASTQGVTWAAFTPPDTTGMTVYRPSAISRTRREPGSSTTANVGPTVHYEAYDRHGNVLQVRRDNEKPVTYVWGYGGLRPVMEITGGTYSQVDSTIGSSALASISDGLSPEDYLPGARTSLEASSDPYMLVSWYLYDIPFGISQASDVSGLLTKYEYDGAGRLKTVKDKDNNRVNTYTYALTNGSGGSPNSITSVTHTTAGSTATAGVKDVAYFDGLGRTVQTVAANASTAASGSSVLRDLVTPVVPDFLDREDAKAYIPYPASTTSSNSGSFRSNALSSQQSYHGSGVRAYTENTYEVSDRGRIVASSLPGFTETTTVAMNASPESTVLKLSYNASTKEISANGYHYQGRFVQTVTEGPDGSRTEVYTDEFGTPVLERVKLDASGTTADTYYIKDVLGRVLCVVPPDQSERLTSSTSGFATDSCYTYKYDGRDRVEKRQTPGGVEETVTYNDMDLPLTRTRKSAENVNVNEVFTTVYDGFNRPVQETYKYGTNSTVTLAEYWYDSYPSGAPSFSAETGYVSTSDTTVHTRGLKTAERVALLPAGVAPSGLDASNTSTKEFRAIYYDKKDRVRQVARTNTQGGTDRISSSYDFSGNLLKERQRIQPGGGQTSHTLDRNYGYDARLRLNTVSALLDNAAAASQVITYDDLQRTYKINRGTNKEVTTMAYTLQGWLSSAISTSWEETLRYASPLKASTDTLPGKAGLITEWVQQQKGTSANGSTTAETFAYSYDKAGRLTGSLRYVGTSSSSVNTLTEQGITYDKSGNLLTLDRYDASSGTTPAESLSYGYTGPRRNSWTYDTHSNVTVDPEGQVNIEWNVLDLPRTITENNPGATTSTQRSYLSDGSLAQVSDGTTTRLYLGDMVFDKASNGTVTLESAGWDGGRLLPGTGIDKVLYVVKDHLGNVRVVRDGSGAVRQRLDYYPYGTASRVWTASSTTDNSEKRYRFGGKEIAGSSLTDLAGYGSAPGAPYLDFGARLYSPRTATWMSPDPLMEKYYSISPFAYCAGNPVNLLDPSGMQWYSYTDDNGNTQYVYYEGEIPDDIKTSYNNLYPMGYSFVADNQYHSLFGRVLDWTDLEGKVYERIDRLIIKYATDREDLETGAQKRVSMFIPDMPRGENRTLGKGRPLIYEGHTFTTLPVGSIQSKQPWYITLFSNGESNYLGNVYWNTYDSSRPDIDVSQSCIIVMPDRQSYNSSFTTKNYYYWLRASNPSNGVNAGFQTLQLLFSPADAKAFMQSYYTIFGQ